MSPRRCVGTILLTAICLVGILLTVNITSAHKEARISEQHAPFGSYSNNLKLSLPKSIEEDSESQELQTDRGQPLPNTTVKIVNLKEMAADEASKGAPASEPREIPFMRDPMEGRREVPPSVQSPAGNHPDSEPPASLMIPSPSTVQSFQALGDNGATIPPDTHGAAGPNHLMTVLNSQVRVQTKTGTILSTVALSTFWASVIPTSDVFDPKVLYDPYSNRWMFTACATRRSVNSGLLIAVSQTNDPTGNWFLFNAKADANSVNWADYPSIGFNKDWIVVSVNMFSNSGDVYAGSKAFVFRKSLLYAGTFNGVTFQRPTGDGFTLAPAVTYSPTEPTVYLLSNWNGNSSGNGFLRLYTITGAVGAEVFTTTAIFPQATGLPWASGAVDNFAPQLNGTIGIMTNESRMHTVVFRNNSLWATHTVFTPATGSPTRSLVQWWQINPSNGAVAQLGRIQDGANFYAFPSIAVNQNNDVLLGYSSFSTSQFATASYAFRAGADAPSTMRDNATLKGGDGCYLKTFGGARNRWGDYSNTVVDPSDDTSFWTIQEYAAQSSPSGQCVDGTGRWGTWWGKISPSGGTCTYIGDPTSRNFSSAGGPGSVNVITGAGCSWTATTDPPSVLGRVSAFSDDLIPTANDLGRGGSTSSVQVVPQTLFLNSTPITINDRTSNTNPPGTGSLYPSLINVSGMTGTITHVDVALNGLSHTWPDDVDVLLVGPGGQRAILMSDAGSSLDVSGVNLTFDQGAAALLPDETQIVSGVYRPTNFAGSTTIEPGGADNFPAPGPGQTVYGADLNVFNGAAPNGNWQLFVVDDENQDSGNIATGWALGITTSGGGTSWITITSGSSGTGNGTVNYSVATNSGTSARSGGIVVNGTIVQTINQSGTIGGVHPPADFDGDFKTDVSVFRGSNGAWYLQQSTAGFAAISFGLNGDLAAPGDYDGDGKADVAVFRPSTGAWYIQRSQLGSFGMFFGQNGDKPACGDFDGDGKTDIAVFRPSTGAWYIQRSQLGFTGMFFGVNGDIPAVGDYDGDLKADIAVFRPSTGAWYLQRSTLGFAAIAFGLNGDKPTPGHYDGDGITDIAVFRQSTGSWYLLRSQLGSTGIAFGANGDKPAPGDYDGDGITDIAVFRPSTGAWYILRSQLGFTGLFFGTNGDVPVPGAYIP